MITLTKNSENTVILELTSVSSLLVPFYLFEFINEINTDNKIYFNGENLSNYTCRNDEFNIVETGTTDVILSASTINLTPGSYRYNIYEASANTLSISGTTGEIIDSGKVTVNGIATEVADIYR